MKFLNLDPNFNPYNVMENKGSSVPSEQTLHFDTFTFKGGEPHIKISMIPFLDVSEEIIITHRCHTFNDLGLLTTAVDALRRIGFKNLNLVLPYFPGARQDRLMMFGEPFTSALYVKLLANMNFKKILSYDVHSDVVPGMFAALDIPFTNVTNHSFVAESIADLIGSNPSGNRVIICPDAGAEKKITALSKHLGSKPVGSYPIIYCGKERNTVTGELTGFEVRSEDLEESDCIIVDDICDGGGTFVGLAEELKKKNAGNLYLIVTHGIFSRGVKVLTDVFKEVHCTNSFDPFKFTNGIISERVKVHNIDKPPLFK